MNLSQICPIWLDSVRFGPVVRQFGGVQARVLGLASRWLVSRTASPGVERAAALRRGGCSLRQGPGPILGQGLEIERHGQQRPFGGDRLEPA